MDPPAAAGVRLPLVESAPTDPERDRIAPSNSRVVRTGGSRVLLYAGRVTADSVIGSRGDTIRVAIPRASVASVENTHFAPLRTIGLFAGIALGALAAAFVAFSSGDPGE
jgi:hypothetical protein